MRVLVLGGTGVISRAIVEQLLAAHHEVVLFNRGTRRLAFAGEVAQLTGDRRHREAFEQEMRRHRFDAVIDMICYDAADARSTLAAFRDTTGHLLVCSSVAAYKRPYKTVPTLEDAEVLWDDPAFGYGFHKAEAERVLWHAIASEQLPVTIFRPSLTFGPGATNVGVLRQNYGIVTRIRQGKPLVMFGDGSTYFSFTFAPDVARGVVGLLGKPETFGQAYHICSEARTTWEDFYLTWGAILGKTPHLVHLPAELLYRAAPNLCAHLYFEKTYGGLFDNSKIRGVLPHFQATISLRAGLETLLAWFEREASTVDAEKDALEDRLVEAYQALAAQLTNLYLK
ncbi:MAG: hypothetical protein KatS3mg131_2706 [Candidatus Tectimicrobiota bacterium]|nr:MAG: hypothetical protein KatS3mg131_2706 [Candidatus Tectomicrobia bacterium]